MRDSQRVVAVLLTASGLALLALPAAAQPDSQLDSTTYPTSQAFADDEGGAHVTYTYAHVLQVAPVYEEVRVAQPVERCDDYQRIERTRPRNAGATVLGAIIGGVIGNQIGSGNGRRAATAAGAVAGGAIGHQASRDSRVVSETRCEMVEEFVTEQQLIGYDVEYRFRDEVFVSRLDYDPGDRLRIRVAVSPADTVNSSTHQQPPTAARTY